MRRRLVLCFVAAVLVSALAGAVAGAGVTRGQREGGAFRVITCSDAPGCFDYLDPALASTLIASDVLQTSCGSLVRYQDKAPPAAYRLVPELAASFPRISRRFCLASTWALSRCSRKRSFRARSSSGGRS